MTYLTCKPPKPLLNVHKPLHVHKSATLVLCTELTSCKFFVNDNNKEVVAISQMFRAW